MADENANQTMDAQAQVVNTKPFGQEPGLETKAESRQVRFSIFKKLLFLFLGVSLASVFVMGFFAYQSSASALKDEAFNKLAAVAELKTHMIEDYFNNINADIELLSSLPLLVTALEDVEEAHEANGQDLSRFVNSPGYQTLIGKFDSYLRNYKDIHGYYDLFLMDHKGNVVYSVERESDFGTNLQNGKFSQSNLARVTKDVIRGREGSIFADFESYAPSGGKPAAFIIRKVQDAQGNLHGAVALQISIQHIDEILQENTGMGKTGETYLLGPDFLMRSDSRLETESTILKRRVATPGALAVFQDKTTERGEGICKQWIYKDYRGVPVLGHNHYMEKQNWAIMSELDKSEAFAKAYALIWKFLILAIVIGLVVAVLAYLVAKAINDPLMQVVSGVRRVAEKNDLTQDANVKSQDEVGLLADMFNAMRKNLYSVVSRIQHASLQVSTSSNQILASANQQQATTNEQAQQMNEIQSTLNENAATSNELSQTAKEVSHFAQDTGVEAQEGTKIIEETSAKMETMSSSNAGVSDRLKALNEKIEGIGKMLSTILTVADQTNLLSLNAAIEAAKAGEQGKGFSVVAQEIRRLADQTAQSSKEISLLVNEIQAASSSAIMVMEKSTGDVQNGIDLVSQLAGRFTAISEKVQVMLPQVESISETINQQAAGSKEIASTVTQMSEGLKLTAASSKQSRQSAFDLNTMGQQLRSAVTQFKLNQGDKSA